MVMMMIEMPETCLKCPFWESSWYRNCKASGVKMPHHEAEQQRHADCPLIEVPVAKMPMTLEELEGCGFEL